ncbi:hypothetical protein ACFL5C_00520 [Candidatus Omnitrophota bacterium]
MKKIKNIMISVLLLMISGGSLVQAQSEFYAPTNPLNSFDFEHDTQGWMIPEWTIGREDYVGQYLLLGNEKSLKNNLSLKLVCKFPRGSWAAALVEYEPRRLIKGGSDISVDVFLPKKARGSEFKARIIITFDKSWRILEGGAVTLKPGKWNKVSLRLNPCETVDRRISLQENNDSADMESISKIAVRVEREATAWDKKRRFKGPIYIDNILIR